MVRAARPSCAWPVDFLCQALVPLRFPPSCSFYAKDKVRINVPFAIRNLPYYYYEITNAVPAHFFCDCRKIKKAAIITTAFSDSIYLLKCPSGARRDGHRSHRARRLPGPGLDHAPCRPLRPDGHHGHRDRDDLQNCGRRNLLQRPERHD
jgi:hypothetical protein